MLDLVIIFILIIILVIVVFTNLSTSISSYSCDPGQCITNIFTGERDCTTLSKEGYWWTCTPEKSCSRIVPYLFFDPEQGTSNVNICPLENPEECRCLPYRLCPDNITTFFVPEVINNFSSPIDDVPYDITETFLVMNNVSIINGVPTSQLPLSPGPNGVCTLSHESLSRVWPRNMIENNKCLTGNLVYDTTLNTFYCENTPEINCIYPNRIFKTGDNYYCEAWA